MDPINSINKDDASVQARARRRRNDQSSRDYTCGCGKSYLSYPALYTHLKYRNLYTEAKTSRKPTSRDHSTQQYESESKQGQTQANENDLKEGKSDDERSISNNEPDETIEQVLLFLDSIGNFRSGMKYEKEEEKQGYLLTCFPKDYFSNSQDYQPIYNNIKDITNERVKNPDQDPLMKEEIDKDKNIKKTQINKILAYFLVAIGPLLNEDAYKEMATFIVLFSIALNEAGYQALQNYEQEQYQQGDTDKKPQSLVKQDQNLNAYCEEQNGEHILLITNEFILSFLPLNFPKLGNIEKSFRIFGSPDEKLKNAVYVTQHLSYWLYAMKFTNSRLALYTDDDQ
ncbi:unnamed protein product (macronuclear) [Paramecium tetraurelia]|uniref:C2H2-type domain-containing protein n=1 Tax=Paramecium tetraurelia TaxID=5888 RepID=A0DG48_PARTE|nr:uncharacterized protein GSPATT00002143001 [Paramecium tetraurelia]CAK82015.1 unnamed protein product [Paramecium tetraurelia]|eukprot:XP_001449412.1 hypothetical protein (macronuclear) [Paramecium tetraurelia strain d4-2]